MRISRCIALLAGMILAAGAVQGQPGEAAQEPPPAVALAELAAHPQDHEKKPLRVVGLLENEGKNYFTDLRLVLKDEDDHFVYVRPWLPAELPAGPPGATGARPETLSKYLGKTVELTAVLDRGPLRGVGDVYCLVVRSAKLVE